MAEPIDDGKTGTCGQCGWNGPVGVTCGQCGRDEITHWREALKVTESWRMTENELHDIEHGHRCATCDADEHRRRTLPCEACGGDMQTGHQRLCAFEFMTITLLDELYRAEAMARKPLRFWAPGVPEKWVADNSKHLLPGIEQSVVVDVLRRASYRVQ